MVRALVADRPIGRWAALCNEKMREDILFGGGAGAGGAGGARKVDERSCANTGEGNRQVAPHPRVQVQGGAGQAAGAVEEADSQVLSMSGV